MNDISVSGWTVTGVDAVVHVIGALDPKPLTIDGHPAKRFKNRACHGLVLRLGGRVRYAVKGHAPIDTLPGTLLYLPEGCDYDVIACEEGDCMCVNFHIAPAAPVAPFMIAPRRISEWERRFADMTRLWTCRPAAYAAHLNARLYEALAGIDAARLCVAAGERSCAGVVGRAYGAGVRHERDVFPAAVPRGVRPAAPPVSHRGASEAGARSAREHRRAGGRRGRERGL